MNLDEKTKIPLFAVLTTIPFIVGAIFWMTAVDSKASQAREDLSGVRGLIMDVRERVIRIEQQLHDHQSASNW